MDNGQGNQGQSGQFPIPGNPPQNIPVSPQQGGVPVQSQSQVQPQQLSPIPQQNVSTVPQQISQIPNIPQQNTTPQQSIPVVPQQISQIPNIPQQNITPQQSIPVVPQQIPVIPQQAPQIQNIPQQTVQDQNAPAQNIPQQQDGSPQPQPIPNTQYPIPQEPQPAVDIEEKHPSIEISEDIAIPKGEDGKVDIIKLIDNIILNAKKSRASDIHIEPTDTDVFIRFRIDGEFHEYFHFPNELKQEIITRAMVIAGLKLDQSRLPQDGEIVTQIEGHELDMRVSTFPAMHGNKIVIRLLEKESHAKTLESLGYEGIPLETIKKNLTRTYGMILMTGPTGSGKSTTLFSMLSSYDPFKYNISTLEDPIEYVLTGANQAQVNADIGFDFPDGLRCLVRQDPDIIMIGEVRDKITANLAVQAALTGHLVFSTLHANSAAATIQRLSNMEVDQFLAASALNIIISQRLVRRNCEACKIQYAPPSDQIKNIQDQMAVYPQLQNMQFYKGQGCEQCGNTGYKGRVAIYEVLPITPNIQKAIIENPTAEYIQQIAIQEGMISIELNGLIKVMEGITTLEEVLIAVDIARKTSS